jgi:hypothetical protein
MEMPRSRSMSIQSDTALARPRLAFTAPASWITPPYSSSFSVSVVLPASGWEMMAKVRRRAIWCFMEAARRRCRRGRQLYQALAGWVPVPASRDARAFQNCRGSMARAMRMAWLAMKPDSAQKALSMKP